MLMQRRGRAFGEVRGLVVRVIAQLRHLLGEAVLSGYGGNCTAIGAYEKPGHRGSLAVLADNQSLAVGDVNDSHH